eukprot:Nitzschia sp. Nitz4//scaffold72_size95085//9529//10647//NITZ4_004743-RA/size95085-augustus-gene-0.63-mRNA-1//1//CDS//3329557324//1037//frame0
MDEELISSPLEKRAYKLALKQNPMFVQSSQLRLRFLRADRFDPKAAAKRFILHFNLKQEFFGEKLLTKDITQDDLEPEDLDVLYNCVAYCMPIKDPAGRLLTVSMFTRLRCREHYGNHESVLFSLQTHGIAMDFVQAAVASNESDAMFWLKRRELERQIPSNSSVGSFVSIPTRSDVLLGRGKSAYNHVGNIRLRNLVERYAKGYEESSFAEKTVLADVIVLQIKKETGRFLRDDGYGWMEVDDETARNKVAHAFRTLRGQKNATGTKTDKKRGREG